MESSAKNPAETIEELRKSFFYGSRSNLNFKFLKDLSDTDFAKFLSDMLDAVGKTTDDGDAGRVVDVAYRWQVDAYGGHLGDPADFPHRYADTPFTALPKPLSECRVGLLTSSGHFVDGDDPEPFGEQAMTQKDAEGRIGEFLRAAPELSTIPVTTQAEQLRVRHGGYPVQAVAADHQVALPIQHLQELAASGEIGEVASSAYSFVGATSQVRLKKDIAPQWAEQLRGDEIDVLLLVPV